LILFLLLVVVITNGNPYKYRFPGMGRYYDKSERIVVATIPDVLPSAPITLLKNDAVLGEWRQRTGRDRPKLVVIATTGGAYRAAFWTTVVLDEFQRIIPEFHRHVRLFTGASGGMVGAGYAAASMTPSGPPEGGFTKRLRDETMLDSLSPVVRRLIIGDLPQTFSPFVRKGDRGVALEQQWRTLDKTFQEVSLGEGEGWRPSLIVSPMVVESGRRLLMSNLDLGALSEARAQPDSPRVFSRPVIEFFRLFPEAWPEFLLQTAVRMSATFPLASPSVSLPVIPPRRVVDAGYYDNYGVDLASLWIYLSRKWIVENTSGVALIQIRAYPSERAVLSYFGETSERPHGLITRLKKRVEYSFQGLTTPAAGGFSAREWSMRFRNATQVRLLHDLLNTPERPDFFETFIFENFTDFAMNWFLSDHDIEAMRHSIGAHDQDPGDGSGGSSAAAGGRRSSSELANAAREFYRHENQDQKKELVRWLSPDSSRISSKAPTGGDGGGASYDPDGSNRL
jgi:hypothetical protein